MVSTMARSTGLPSSRRSTFRIVASSATTATAAFAPANNQGLAAARGEIFVLLNNDTVLTPGWLDGLRRHVAVLKSAASAPAPTASATRRRWRCSYRTAGELRDFALRRTREHAGEIFDIPHGPDVLLRVSPRRVRESRPDRRTVRAGMFEDDDYAMRIRATGLRVCCADDVFVHHFGQASFRTCWATGNTREPFAGNRARFERKWGMCLATARSASQAGLREARRSGSRSAAARAIPAQPASRRSSLTGTTSC
jgi:GT2 family glycosyltransferase